MAAQSWGTLGGAVQICSHDSGSWREPSAFWNRSPMFRAGGVPRDTANEGPSPVPPSALLLVSSPELGVLVLQARTTAFLLRPSKGLEGPRPRLARAVAAGGALQSILGALRPFSSGSYRALLAFLDSTNGGILSQMQLPCRHPRVPGTLGKARLLPLFLPPPRARPSLAEGGEGSRERCYQWPEGSFPRLPAWATVSRAPGPRGPGAVRGRFHPRTVTHRDRPRQDKYLVQAGLFLPSAALSGRETASCPLSWARVSLDDVSQTGHGLSSSTKMFLPPCGPCGLCWDSLSLFSSL